jgi:Ala-tRNA(Pro) deacylase
VILGWSGTKIDELQGEEVDMAVLAKLEEYLHRHQVPYQVHAHPQRFTAQEVAEVEHVPGIEVAKTVILRAGKEYLMAVVPATFRVDIGKLRQISGQANLHLAGEAEFAPLFPGCEPGAMPPFGNLFGMPVWVDEALAKQPEIIFNAGDHERTVHMAYADFARLVQPRVLAVGEPARK